MSTLEAFVNYTVLEIAIALEEYINQPDGYLTPMDECTIPKRI
jgi:hypothetical protein